MAAVTIVPITDFRNKIKEVLEQVKISPVILTQRSHPAAVVVDYAAYQEQAERLEELELKLADLLLAQAMRTSPGLVSLDELLTDSEKKTTDEPD